MGHGISRGFFVNGTKRSDGLDGLKRPYCVFIGPYESLTPKKRPSDGMNGA